jgi:tetratricopeptide repeat protein 30
LNAWLQDARNTANTQILTQRMREYEDAIEQYIPVLMAQAQIFWDQGQYSNVLAVLQQSKEFVGENETWKLNLAHTYFMLVSHYPAESHVLESFGSLCMRPDWTHNDRVRAVPGTFDMGHQPENFDWV